jgi:hypothetical protein
LRSRKIRVGYVLCDWCFRGELIYRWRYFLRPGLEVSDVHRMEIPVIIGLGASIELRTGQLRLWFAWTIAQGDDASSDTGPEHPLSETDGLVPYFLFFFGIAGPKMSVEDETQVTSELATRADSFQAEKTKWIPLSRITI